MKLLGAMMMNCRCLAVLFTAATVMAAADVASAQPAAPQELPVGGADAAARADASYRRGLRLYSDKKYVEAEAELLSAWELGPTFDVAYNLGNTKYQLKKYREAATYLSFALRNWPRLKTVAKLRPTAEQRLAESRAQVGAVTVTVSIAGAEVLVDGKSVGRAPLEGEVFVEPGEHLVEARLEGYAPTSQTVAVAKGATATATLALALAKSEGPMAAGATPEGGASGAGAGVVGPVAGPPAVPIEPPPREKKSWVPVIALGAASAVGLGVGIGMTVASNNANSEGRVQRDQIFAAGGGCLASPSFAEQCAEVERSAESAGLLGDVALGSYIASGVLAAAAVTYALWPARRTDKSTAVLVLPEPRVDGFGFLMAGAW